MKASIRPATARDINYLMDIDLKCYEYPLDYSAWRVYITSPDIELLVATIEAAPIGFIVFTKTEILRLAVKAAYRKEGTGSRLINNALDSARQAGGDKLDIIVPETSCLPGHPDDVSAFLMGNNFVAKPPIIEGIFEMYGRPVDGYCFESPEWLHT
jgi:GNAT superfamily N-acetyltransferase